MYDPMTVAHEIKYPWRGRKSKMWPKGYRSSFITIWHVDPEKDGTDDSCHWSGRRAPLPAPLEKAVQDLIKDESYAREIRYAYSTAYVHDPRYQYNAMPQCVAYIAGLSVMRQLLWAAYRKGLDNRAINLVADLTLNPYDDINSVHEGDGPEKFIRNIARNYARIIRPWWKHPRWHVHHWKFQIHPLQALRRRLFDRCASCGKPFIRESPVSNGADKLWHMACYPNERGGAGIALANSLSNTWDA